MHNPGRLGRKHQGWKGALSYQQGACYMAVELRIAQAIMTLRVDQRLTFSDPGSYEDGCGHLLAVSCRLAGLREALDEKSGGWPL
jgi:hypothetical protein